MPLDDVDDDLTGLITETTIFSVCSVIGNRDEYSNLTNADARPPVDHTGGRGGGRGGCSG